MNAETRALQPDWHKRPIPWMAEGGPLLYRYFENKSTSTDWSAVDELQRLFKTSTSLPEHILAVVVK